MTNKTDTSITPPPINRMIIGGGVFIVGFIAPVLVPVVTGSDLPATWKTVLSGLLVVGIPEIGMLLAVAILGKDGFNYLKTRLWRSMKPAEHVSAYRYRFGLVLFFLPLLLALITPYAQQWLPGYESNRIHYGLIGDAMFITSLFVLGGDFWDKLRSLFVHRSRAVFDNPST